MSDDQKFPNQDVLKIYEPVFSGLTIMHNDKPVLILHADGRITVDESMKPDEAARHVLEAMRRQWMMEQGPVKGSG